MLRLFLSKILSNANRPDLRLIQLSDLNQDSDLTKDLNINSAYLVDVVLDVEDTYNVEFTNQDMEKLRTVNDAIEIIQNKISNKE